MESISKVMQFVRSFNLFIVRNFDEFIDLSKTIDQTNYWIKKSQIISVDFTQLYFGKFISIRYWICCIHFITMICGLISCILVFSNDWVFNLIDNEYLPKNFRKLILGGILLLIITISFRFDLLLAEWNGNIFVFKMFYCLEQDIKSKHGLTDENYKKFSILAKLLVVCFKIGSPFVIVFVSLYYLYIAILSNKIILQLLIPFAFDIFWLIVSTCSVAGIFCISITYYYILLLSQINAQINLIYKQSKLLIRYRRQLILLTEKHNFLAEQIAKINQVFRRSILGFFIILTLGLVVSLNLYLKTNNQFEQFMLLSIFFISFIGGFGVATFMSTVIRVAHKPYKTIYKILQKQNFILNSKSNFQFKWKVINSF